MKTSIREIEITKLEPAEDNPRVDLQSGDHRLEALKQSIDKFGYVEPIVWNSRTGHVVGGHQRLKAIRELEPERGKVQCVVVDLPAKKEKALGIALNRIKGDWDYEKLALVVEELSEDLLKVTGLSEDEISKLTDDSDADIERFMNDQEEVEPEEDEETYPEDEEDPADSEEMAETVELYISFESKESAEAFLVSEGMDAAFPKGKRSCVVHMG